MADLWERGIVTKLRSLKTGRTIGGIPFGCLYDDRGNRLTPSHVRKDGIKYRYYLSSPLLQGQPAHAGSVRRVPAAAIEALVALAVCENVEGSAESDERDVIRNHVVRVDLQVDQLAIELKADPRDNDRLVLRIPWKKTPMKRRREIIVPASVSAHELRPIRAETRATLVAAIARGRCWLDEIVAGTVTSVEQIAAREQCSIRQVHMTISLAFLAPGLVKAAIERRLPRGIGVTRLRDAAAEWSRQYAMLGCRFDPGGHSSQAAQARAMNGFVEREPPLSRPKPLRRSPLASTGPPPGLGGTNPNSWRPQDSPRHQPAMGC
jgi:hypothetical protein